MTSVGATNGIPETASALSAGGFSNLFPIPSYQSSQVSSYISSLGSTYSGLYNSTGRGYPDLSAYGITATVFNNTLIESLGTSVATPIVASLFAIVNGVRLANGKSTLGLVNTLLYSTLESSLNDITSGNNPGCGTNGFSAKTGWDPVSHFFRIVSQI